MPTAGENRMESIYRNPVGAQSGIPVEGQSAAPKLQRLIDKQHRPPQAVKKPQK
jgi:hypothetical protein